MLQSVYSGDGNIIAKWEFESSPALFPAYEKTHRKVSRKVPYPRGFASTVIFAGEQEGDCLAGMLHGRDCILGRAAPLAAHVNHERLDVGNSPLQTRLMPFIAMLVCSACMENPSLLLVFLRVGLDDKAQRQAQKLQRQKLAMF